MYSIVVGAYHWNRWRVIYRILIPVLDYRDKHIKALIRQTKIRIENINSILSQVLSKLSIDSSKGNMKGSHKYYLDTQ